jgi:hypothetical protein
MFIVLALILSSSPAFPLGGEGHQVVGLIAEKYTTATAQAKASDLLDGSTIDLVASWADEYRHGHRETGMALHRHPPCGFKDRLGPRVP